MVGSLLNQTAPPSCPVEETHETGSRQSQLQQVGLRQNILSPEHSFRNFINFPAVTPSKFDEIDRGLTEICVLTLI